MRVLPGMAAAWPTPTKENPVVPGVMVRHMGANTARKMVRAGYIFQRNDGPVYFCSTPEGDRKFSLFDLFEIADAL